MAANLFEQFGGQPTGAGDFDIAPHVLWLGRANDRGGDAWRSYREP
jgi:hypothetical protein